MVYYYTAQCARNNNKIRARPSSANGYRSVRAARQLIYIGRRSAAAAAAALHANARLIMRTPPSASGIN